MKLLITDFISRWRWVIFGYFFAVLARTVFDCGAPLALVALICFSADWQRGVVRVVRPLPVSIRHQALAWWFVCIGLLPLLGLVAIAFGLWLGGRLPLLPHEFAAGFVHWKETRGAYSLLSPKTEPIFAVMLGWWLGLGASALLYLPQVAVPKAHSSSRLRWLWQGGVAITVGLAAPVMIMMMFFAPQSLEQMKPSYWMACATVPLWVVWSFAKAFQRPHPVMPSMQMITPKTETDLAVPLRGGLGGMPSLLVMMHARLLLMLVAIVCMFHLIMLFMTGRPAGRGTGDFGSPLSLQMIMMAGVSCTMCGDMWNLRSLRTLPLTTGRLAFLLMSVPLVLGLAVSCLSPVGAWAFHVSVPLAQALAEGGLAAVLGALCLTIGLYFTQRGRMVSFLILFPLMAGGTIFGMKKVLSNVPMLTALGAVLIILCYVLIHRGLRRSPAFYKVRQLPGAWGQVSMRG